VQIESEHVEIISLHTIRTVRRETFPIKKFGLLQPYSNTVNLFATLAMDAGMDF